MRTLLGLILLLASNAWADDYTVQGAKLDVTVHFERDTGTWHTATALDLRSEAAVLTVPLAADGMLPLVDKVIDLGARRWLLLGWWSQGGGMQTDVAWLVVARGTKLVVADTLESTTDRSHPGLAWASDRVGVLAPPPVADRHDPDEWGLVIGRKPRSLGKLAFTADDTAIVYRGSIYQDAPCPCRVAWFAIKRDRFVATR